MAGTSAVTPFGSTDGGFESDKIVKKVGDSTRREFTYFVLGGARFIYASAARLALIKVNTFSLDFILKYLCYFLHDVCIYLPGSLSQA